MTDPAATLPDYITTSSEYTLEELASALRNRELPAEALRFDITPTGLHYLLAHFDIPAVDPASWMLEIGGAVRRPARLGLDQLRALGTATQIVTLECAGNGRGYLQPRPIGQPWLSGAVSTAAWTGTPLSAVLTAVEPLDDAVEVVFAGADRAVAGEDVLAFERSLTLAECAATGALLAWQMNGEALPPHHGAPVRLVVPGWYGMASVKWLERITLAREPFRGEFQLDGYRIFQLGTDEAPPLTTIRPRAAFVPPGLPDVATASRVVRPGRTILEGKAWSGQAEVVDVQVQVGDGPWRSAVLDPPLARHAWRVFRYEWEATEGTWVVRARAADATGDAQPLEPPWNLHGYANNTIQAITVRVTGALQGAG